MRLASKPIEIVAVQEHDAARRCLCGEEIATSHLRIAGHEIDLGTGCLSALNTLTDYAIHGMIATSKGGGGA